MKNAQVTRRQFMVSGLTASGGLLLGLPASSAVAAAASGISNDRMIGYFIEIKPNNQVILGSNQPEIGQGIHTVHPMMVAEELDINWSQVEVSQMPLGIVKTADGFTWKYGGQGVGGSTGTRGSWQFMREVGAKARAQLIKAAAQVWQVDAKNCHTEAGHVIGPDGQKASYADLITVAAKLPLPDEAPPLKDPKNFKILGQPKHAVGVKDMVTGQTQYGIDTFMPGMKVAVIQRSPYLDGTVESFDDSETMKVPGVLKTMTIKGPEAGKPYNILASGVAVIAENTWAAIKGRNALKIKWQHDAEKESTELFDKQLEQLLKAKGQVVRNDGDFDTTFKDSKSQLTQQYYVPFVSHAPLEPQNCFAHVKDNQAHIIVPTQMPSGASRSAAAETGLDRLDRKI